MRILYGVVGEGMGHAMRARVIVDHLVGEGHEVEIMTSQRAVDYLRASFPKVHRIHGLHIITEDNRVRRGKTLFSNVLQGTAALPRQIASYFDLIQGFQPQAVVSDFESWTYYYAKAHRLPVISVDNQQVINRCKHPPRCSRGHRQTFEVTRAFIKSKLPFCDHYLVTTFFRPPLRKERTSLHPPILRPIILQARPSAGDHLLVYQTAEGHTALADMLQRTGLECRIYGMRRHITEEQVEGNLRFRPFSETRFIEDLASARAVVAGGGFTLLSEAVYLHKPHPVGAHRAPVRADPQRTVHRARGLRPVRPRHRRGVPDALPRRPPPLRGAAFALPAGRQPGSVRRPRPPPGPRRGRGVASAGGSLSVRPCRSWRRR
jgi:uncharacterized protein (TIGR00661 family)